MRPYSDFQMSTRFRCPICGMMPWVSTLDRYHDLEFYVQELVIGYAKGWRFHVVEPSIDDLVSLRVRLAVALMLVDRLIEPLESQEIDIEPIVLDVFKQPSVTVSRDVSGFVSMTMLEPTSRIAQGRHSRIVHGSVLRLTEVN